MQAYIHPVLNKTMTTHKQFVKYNFGDPLTHAKSNLETHKLLFHTFTKASQTLLVIPETYETKAF